MSGGREAPTGLGRRRVLRAALAASVGLLAGCSDGNATGDGRASTSTPTGDDGSRIEPVDLEAIEAPGSPGGTVAVPAADTVTVVDLFATWCGPCVEQLERLRAAHAAVGDRTRFVSVTNEAFGGSFTRGDLREWWADHGGPWPVAHDAEGTLFFRLDATGIPYTAVVDAEGRVTWSHSGLAEASTVVDHVEAVAADG